MPADFDRNAIGSIEDLQRELTGLDEQRSQVEQKLKTLDNSGVGGAGGRDRQGPAGGAWRSSRVSGGGASGGGAGGGIGRGVGNVRGFDRVRDGDGRGSIVGRFVCVGEVGGPRWGARGGRGGGV